MDLYIYIHETIQNKRKIVNLYIQARITSLNIDFV